LGKRLRILLTGSSGQVGGELLHTLAPLGEVIAPARDEMDLADPITVGDFIAEIRPDWIVNAAAYTAVDQAESEPERADIVNRYSVGVIGREAAAIGAAVIHFSTDYVFSGEGQAAYKETDPTGPLSVYGVSKLAGEQALAASGAAHLIFRTSWVYGATGKNFLKTILRLACERDQIRIVDDQHGAPTWSRDLARLTAHAIAHCEGRSGDSTTPEAMTDLNGVYHASGAGETTWCGFAREAIAMQQAHAPQIQFAQVVGIPTTAYPTPARRPHNSRLDCSKLRENFHWEMMDWQEALGLVLQDINGHAGEGRSGHG
jgi:dTDP-4-dehydrorhamnose reductase